MFVEKLIDQQSITRFDDQNQNRMNLNYMFGNRGSKVNQLPGQIKLDIEMVACKKDVKNTAIELDFIN